MLDTSDPATIVAWVLLVALVLASWRLEVVRRRRQEGRRRLAERVGHPSTFRRAPERPPLRLAGMDGEYVVHFRFHCVELAYETNAGVEFLGRYTTEDDAIGALTVHDAAQTAH